MCLYNLGDCWGGGGSNSSTSLREHLTLETFQGTQSPCGSCRFNTNLPTLEERSYALGVVLDHMCMAMKSCISHLCIMVFQGEIMKHWKKLDKAETICIIDQNLQEFKPVPGGQEVS